MKYFIDYFAHVLPWGCFNSVEIEADTQNEARTKAIAKARANFKRNHPHVTSEPEIEITFNDKKQNKNGLK